MMHKEELIQNYIAGRLSEDERARVAEMLQTDTELQELYATHHEMRTAFRLSKSNDLKKRLEAIDAQEMKDSLPKKSRKNMIRIAIAAIFVIGVTFMLTFTQSNNDLYKTYFETFPNTYLPEHAEQQKKHCKRKHSERTRMMILKLLKRFSVNY